MCKNYIKINEEYYFTKIHNHNNNNYYYYNVGQCITSVNKSVKNFLIAKKKNYPAELTPLQLKIPRFAYKHNKYLVKWKKKIATSKDLFLCWSKILKSLVPFKLKSWPFTKTFVSTLIIT